MQQHSKSPQSIHFVFPPVASAGLMMLSMVEEAALPGPFLLTRECDEPQAIFDCVESGVIILCLGLVSDTQLGVDPHTYRLRRSMSQTLDV
ncbi:hypothetical protein F4805DRAFT_405204 [Annulohypoxylon moriforme]|nr:hypothetical protein F4805DRAFT_405204 [Annulohypoxylon moriforme]